MDDLGRVLDRVASDFQPILQGSNQIEDLAKRRRTGRRIVSASFLASLTVLAVVGLQAWSNGRLGRNEPEASGNLGIQPPPGHGPFLRGVSTSLGELKKAADFHLFRPNDTLASDETLAAAWFEPESSQVGLQYTSGVLVTLQPMSARCPSCPAPREEFRRRAAQLGPPVRVQLIQGVPALVIPSNIPAHVVNGNLVSGGPQASVELVIDGIHVGVTGRMKVDELVRVAMSLR